MVAGTQRHPDPHLDTTAGWLSTGRNGNPERGQTSAIEALARFAPLVAATLLARCYRLVQVRSGTRRAEIAALHLAAGRAAGPADDRECHRKPANAQVATITSEVAYRVDLRAFLKGVPA